MNDGLAHSNHDVRGSLLGVSAPANTLYCTVQAKGLNRCIPEHLLVTSESRRTSADLSLALASLLFLVNAHQKFSSGSYHNPLDTKFRLKPYT